MTRDDPALSHEVTACLNSVAPAAVVDAAKHRRAIVLLISASAGVVAVACVSAIFGGALVQTPAYLIVLGGIFLVFLMLLAAAFVLGRHAKRAFVHLEQIVAQQFGAQLVRVDGPHVTVRRRFVR